MKYLSLSIPGLGGTPIQLEPPSGVPSGGLDPTGNKVLGVAIELLLIGAVLLSIYYIIRGGVNMMTSGGDKEKFTAGRERVRYAIIGLILIFLSFFFLNVIGTFFGINLIGKQPAPATHAPTPAQQEQKPKSIDEQLMKICTDRWGQSYCTCLLGAKSTLTTDQQTQVSNTIIETNQIPQRIIDLAKSRCGDAR